MPSMAEEKNDGFLKKRIIINASIDINPKRTINIPIAIANTRIIIKHTLQIALKKEDLMH